eukprot:4775700-Pleurochrysis_carterae.AAC.1
MELHKHKRTADQTQARAVARWDRGEGAGREKASQMKESRQRQKARQGERLGRRVSEEAQSMYACELKG